MLLRALGMISLGLSARRQAQLGGRRLPSHDLHLDRRREQFLAALRLFLGGGVL